MGENQGMIWIILGVIVVGAVIIGLGNTMKNGTSKADEKIVTDGAASGLEFSTGQKTN